jgi:hypothetical protein
VFTFHFNLGVLATCPIAHHLSTNDLTPAQVNFIRKVAIPIDFIADSSSDPCQVLLKYLPSLATAYVAMSYACVDDYNIDSRDRGNTDYVGRKGNHGFAGAYLEGSIGPLKLLRRSWMRNDRWYFHEDLWSVWEGMNADGKAQELADWATCKRKKARYIISKSLGYGIELPVYEVGKSQEWR